MQLFRSRRVSHPGVVSLPRLLPPAGGGRIRLLALPSGLAFAVAVGLLAPRGVAAQVQILGDPPDVSEHFTETEQVYFVGRRVTEFDPVTGAGRLQWDRYVRRPSYSFNKLDMALVRAESNEFPGTEYDRDPALPFEITFVTPRTVRLRFATRDRSFEPAAERTSLMLAGPVATDRSWRVESTDSVVRYRSEHGEVRLIRDPWHIEFYDAAGELLTRTQTLGDPASFTPYVPFSFVRRARDFGRSTAATFELRHDEKL